ncbi:MAG: amino acid permease [Opitutaceae bacterium]|nr:amino acid permease [Opitutaceae bacterium]
MPSPENDVSPAQSHLGLADSVSIIVGIVIGAGIYETAPFILSCVASPTEAMLVWFAGGVLSVIGALCYAELATTYPRSGGDYYFLKRAYGRWAGFLFSWSQLTVIMSGSIGLMAFVFADYAVRLLGARPESSPWFAMAAVIILSLANIAGLKSGRRTQNVLTGLKAVGLAAIVLAGFLSPQVHAEAPAAVPAGAGIGLALILVLYTYGGWNDAAFIVAEMKDRRRNIPRALLLGTAGVAAIYLLINAAYLNALGFTAARSSKAIAADVLQGPFSASGAAVMSALVVVSALGALNGLVLTGGRIYAAAGADFPAFAVLSRWHSRWGTPAAAIAVQMVTSVALVWLVGHPAGRALIGSALQRAGFGAVSWDGHGGFDTLLKCTAPVFWLFFLLTGGSLFVLRRKDRALERAFAVPLFPLLPLIFCGMCGYMLYSAANYAGRLTLVGLAPPLAGLLVYLFFGRQVLPLDGSPEPAKPPPASS